MVALDWGRKRREFMCPLNRVFAMCQFWQLTACSGTRQSGLAILVALACIRDHSLTELEQLEHQAKWSSKPSLMALAFT